MANLTAVLFRIAAALFAFAALLPLVRGEGPNVVFLVLGVAFLVLSLTLRATKQEPVRSDSAPPDDAGDV